VSGSGISWAICKSTSRSRQITTPALHHSSFFTGRMPFLPPNQQRRSTEGTNLHKILNCELHKNAFSNGAPPGPAGGAIALDLPDPLAVMGEGREKAKGGGAGRERGGREGGGGPTWVFVQGRAEFLVTPLAWARLARWIRRSCFRQCLYIVYSRHILTISSNNRHTIRIPPGPPPQTTAKFRGANLSVERASRSPFWSIGNTSST